MFGFLQDMGNYETRKVARYEDKEADLAISTARTSDGIKPYENAVCHPDYNNNSWIIAEGYDTRGEAQKGHEYWIKIMTAEKLPDSLTDCANAACADTFIGKQVFQRKKSGSI